MGSNTSRMGSVAVERNGLDETCSMAEVLDAHEPYELFDQSVMWDAFFAATGLAYLLLASVIILYRLEFVRYRDDALLVNRLDVLPGQGC